MFHSQTSSINRLNHYKVQNYQKYYPLNKDCKIKKQIFHKVKSGRPVILPIFSPRSAKLLLNELDLTGFHVAAMSEAVSKELGSVDLAELVISEKPDLISMQEATLAILRRLIKFDSYII